MGRKKIYCVFDTETIGVDKKWIYDLGLVIVEKTGKPLFKKEWIIKEIMDIPNIREIAFYGKKMETFYKRKATVPFKQAREEFCQILEDYKVNSITAYNLQFDMAALSDTCQKLEIGKKFLKRKIEYFDLWNASCDSIFQQKKFKEIASKENWLTEKGNIRTSAEIAYRFITRNYQFIESHTALHDAEIEGKILQAVIRQKKKIIRNELVAHPWRKVNKKGS